MEYGHVLGTFVLLGFQECVHFSFCCTSHVSHIHCCCWLLLLLFLSLSLFLLLFSSLSVTSDNPIHVFFFENVAAHQGALVSKMMLGSTIAPLSDTNMKVR